MKQIIFLILSLMLTIGVVFASTYSGDGTYTVKNGDKIIGNNNYSITIWEVSQIGVSFQTITYTTYLSEGQEGKYSIAVSGGPNVLRVKINSIDKVNNTASITLTSIYEVEKQPEIPFPETSPKPEGKTYVGDGRYNLSPNDKIQLRDGYTLKYILYKKDVQWWTKYQDDVIRVTGNMGTLGLFPPGVNQSYYGSAEEVVDSLYPGSGTNIFWDKSGFTVLTESLKKDSDVIQVYIYSGKTITLNPGWNLFSAPFSWSVDIPCENAQCYGPGTGGLKILENNCGALDSLKIWRWNPKTKLYSKSLPYPKGGYWLKVDTKCSITFGGAVITLDDFELEAGWNQIGGPTKSINIEDIKGNCNIVSGPWRYLNQHGRFEKTTTLSAGEGYFIKVSENCRLEESGPPTPPK